MLWKWYQLVWGRGKKCPYNGLAESQAKSDKQIDISMDVKITAVICTRDRAHFLEKCILSFLDQTASPEFYEILVVDNGSSDNTSEIIEKFRTEANFRSVFEPVAGLSRARNTGWRNARGGTVGYIDDDAIVDRLWVESVIEVLEQVIPQPDWIGGPIHLDWQVAGPDWINKELNVPLGFVDWGDVPRRLNRSERLGGGNSLYRKEILQELGGFDERLGRDANSLLSGEETQLQKRIEAAGGYLYYHPGIMIYHFVGKERIKPQWFYRRYYWGGVSDYYMSKTLGVIECQEEPLAEDHVAEPAYAQVMRIVSNALISLGIFSGIGRTVHARIYLAYVFGRVSGVFRWIKNKP